MIFPSVDRLADKVESRYTLAMLAAKRAKQLREGAPKLIDTTSTNSLTIALEEIAAGKITFRVPSNDDVLTRAEEPEMVLVPETEESEAAGIAAEQPVDEAARVAELLKVPGEKEPAEEPKEFDAAEIAALLVDQEPAPEMEAATESEEEETVPTDEETAEPAEDQAEQPAEE